MKWRLSNEGYLVTGKKPEIKQHRVVWEAHHGPIPKGAVIHHRNGIKHDNRIENLELFASNGEHMSHHHDKSRELGVVKNCLHCGKEFSSFQGKKYCTRICKGNASRDRWKTTEKAQVYMRDYQKKWQEANRDKCHEYWRRYDAKRRGVA
jgi:hypothetical protein